MNTTSTQFKTLIQNEIKRLESVIAHNEHSYPVAFRPYIFARQEASTKQKPSRYYGFLSFVRVVQFLF
jgi:hypothetical protein